MRLTSRDVTLVPAMAVVAAVCHLAIGPTILMAFHIPGPTLAGPLILAPIMIAGAVTQKRGILFLTSVINALILSFFVPIGFLAFPIFSLAGLVLELFYIKSMVRLFSLPYSFLAGGVSNAISVLLIATFGMRMLMGGRMQLMGMQGSVLVAFITVVGLITGGVGGLIASTIMLRIRHLYPSMIAYGHTRPQCSESRALKDFFVMTR